MRKLLPLAFLFFSQVLNAQDLNDTKVAGIVPFAANSFQDSIAAKDIYAAVARIMIQTKRFTLLEIEKWKLVQEEIRRQKGKAFMESKIIDEGKSLGAQILIFGTVKNAEIYQEKKQYIARVDYEVKCIDVLTGKSIAAQSFTGNSEDYTNVSAEIANGLRNMIPVIRQRRSGSEEKVVLTETVFETLSETDKGSIKGKMFEAIEESIGRVNGWIRNTFGMYLPFLRVMDEDKRNGAENILIEGGENIAMRKGCKLKTVLITQIEKDGRQIRDEEPIAELEVIEVRAQTSKCKVVKGGKRMVEEKESKNIRIVFL
ncbi:Peptidoglycan-synthase activator LpoB [Chitinophaga sp. CF118]|uniref:hypothetical protein n=1 Tax=Chitinophaga sp. CF118 TaxID=1884367 RepID=UPI0008EB3A45|nr:hypothetical protein [Chitinophaga sp. CF118]SFE17928.1 Peptidoglycan-synthase activator LpoB [Chitinophaga sp. CF118]